MYRAVADGSADVITAFSSDGRIAALDLVTLADPAPGAAELRGAAAAVAAPSARPTRRRRRLTPTGRRDLGRAHAPGQSHGRPRRRQAHPRPRPPAGSTRLRSARLDQSNSVRNASLLEVVPNELSRGRTSHRFRRQIRAAMAYSTVEISYYMPDHPALLQLFIWQHYDVAPQFPVRAQTSSTIWRREMRSGAPFCAGRPQSPASVRPRWRAVDRVITDQLRRPAFATNGDGDSPGRARCEGAGNKALIAFLTIELNVSSSTVRIVVRAKRPRHKMVRISGLGAGVNSRDLRGRKSVVILTRRRGLVVPRNRHVPMLWRGTGKSGRRPDALLCRTARNEQRRLPRERARSDAARRRRCHLELAALLAARLESIARPNNGTAPAPSLTLGQRAPMCARISCVATVAQLVRASVCGTEGRGFKSRRSPHFYQADRTDRWTRSGIFPISTSMSSCISSPIPKPA